MTTESATTTATATSITATSATAPQAFYPGDVLPRLPALTLAHVPEEFRDAYQALSDSRGGIPTSFATFFNSPRTAIAVGEFGGHLRFDGGWTVEQVELVIMAVSAALHDEYLWAHHLDLARSSGVTDAELEAMQASPAPQLSSPERTELAALAIATALGEVTDPKFSRAAEFFTPRELVDIVFMGAYYQLIHRSFGALRIVGDHDTRRPHSPSSPTEVPPS